MRMDDGQRVWRAGGVALLGAALCAGAAACSEPKGGPAGPAGSASAAAQAPASAAPASSLAIGVPAAPEKVAKIMNPKGVAPYDGPTGTLKGHVRIKGDAPPETPHQYPPGKCGEAAAAYGRLFRVGQDGALADALVTVVNYDAYVPERDEAEKITIHGCALARRTVAMSFGQRLEVSNLDPIETYMPYLDGAPQRAMMVAVPGGDAVRLYPPEPGHYMIRDTLPKPFLTADVFVLKFSTHAVTDLDGEFEIKGIPVGKVMTAAYLPSLNEDVKKEIEIKPGDNTIDFELAFDLAKWKAKKEKQKDASQAPPKEGPKG